ncbi:MAG: restriction endonuclease subunit S [Desulfitobacteriaceae bacterium]|nr:restriction endonuclease subunit S [Desulfitobacteriaceae bacterium]
MSFSEWEEVKLGDIANYVTERISLDKLGLENYVSTENMLPDKGGKVTANSLPTTGNVVKYYRGQTLISNIRPYFRKIWFADVDGGCSNDVLVFHLSREIYSKYFYYNLSQDAFFDFVMAGSKGTKMPRGDKHQIMMYPCLLPPISEQKAIADTLSCLDDKIELNNRINKTLEEMAQAIFKSWFVDFEPFQEGEFEDSELGRIPKGWRVGTLGDCVESIDNRGKTPHLASEVTEYPIIDVKALSGRSRIINFGNCTKYVKEETYNNWFRSGHPKIFDILISTVGSLAEMKLFYGNIGCIAQNVVGFRSKNISPLYLYQYLQHIKNDLISYNIGSVQPSIKVTHIIKHKILIPCDEKLKQFDYIINKISNMIFKNFEENQTLTAIRNTLLPKLMSGEIRVPIEEVQ